MTSEPSPSPHPGPSLWVRVRGPLVRHRARVQIVVDASAWAVGLLGAMVLRFEFELRPGNWGQYGLRSVFGAMVVAILLQIVVGFASGLYRGRWRFGSFEEVAHLVGAVAATTLALALTNAVLFPMLVPTSVTIAAGLIALLIMAGTRYGWRLNMERQLRPSGDGLHRALVFGAGEGGTQVITAMLRNPESPYLPVGLLDDHPSKRNLRIMGVPVRGGRHDMSRLARELDADTLVIAVPSAESELVRDLSHLALDAELSVKILPTIDELLGAHIGIGDLRPLTEADLLGRHEIDTDLDAIAGYLTGRRVLVTGAGGSIGSELSYQISRLAPDRLVLLDRDESALHGAQLRIEGRAMLDSRDLVVCDIRDRQALAEVFAEHRPEVVFHAAALKHLPLLERFPAEAVKTNVWGTRNVLELSSELGASRVVNISTDKAADPTSVLGYTKRIAEMLTADVARTTDGTYLSVRFGNVLGSRGSVLTAFEAQITAGGPVTVTDPEVTRYFMTVEEAVQLVIQAGAVGRDGEALVLDMGEPVCIADVARRLAAQADRPIEIVFTGLRPGEKLHETLIGSDEVDVRPAHPLISHVEVPPLDAGTIERSLDGEHDTAHLIDALRRLASPRASTAIDTGPDAR